MAEQAVSRRAFLRFGAATAVTAGTVVALGSGTASAQTADVQTFRLDPTGGGSSVCNACRGHAANKVFRASGAADARRAHKGCRCTVVKGPSLPAPIADAVFGKSDVADRRDAKIAELLDSGTVAGVEVPVFAAGAPIILAVGGGLGYWFLRRRNREPATVHVDRGEWK